MMKTYFIIIVSIGLLLTTICSAQNPPARWQKYSTPEQAGWSSKKLNEVAKNSNAASIVFVHDGKIVFSYGEYWRRIKTHSMRKSLISALYGIHVENGNINLNKTLSELSIDDKTPLTESEKEAKIIDILKARSGVYITAAAETKDMKEIRPQRGSHGHGTYWYYNNWDFNVLGTIFNQETKSDIFHEFYSKIALPLNMQDFRLIDGTYDYELEYSNHPSYPFKMSGRDLARFGQLYLQDGKWNGKQIISEDWIKKSTTSWSKVENSRKSYGYLWWIEENFHNSKIFYAAGYGGQFVGVFPNQNAVLVLQANTYDDYSIYDLNAVIENIIISSKISNPVPNPTFVTLEEPEEYPSIKLTDIEQQKYIKSFPYQDSLITISKVKDELILEKYHYYYKFKLLPISKSVFYVEDIDLYLYFEITENDMPVNPEFHKSKLTAEMYNLIINIGVDEGVIYFYKNKHLQKSEEELRFLSKTFEQRNMDNTKIMELNALCYPNSFRVLREYKDELIKKYDIKTASKLFIELNETLIEEGFSNSKAECFSKILQSQANPIKISEEKITEFKGNYGQRRIIYENGNLYYTRDDLGRKFKLYKISECLFALENKYYFWIEFGKDKNDKVTKIIGYYSGGATDESSKDI